MTEIIAEIGINHNGLFWKAMQMIRDAAAAGCKTVKFQCHVTADEYHPSARSIIPANSDEDILTMMERCSFDEGQERDLKTYAETLGMEYLCTPFSRAAADRLERLGVRRYKIGSGECSNIPLIEHIAAFGKPIILSTGMNDFDMIDLAVEAVGDCPLTLMHCVSEYPTPYEHVNLRRMLALQERYNVPVGLSDHSLGIYTALAAVALGASVVEKHFTSSLQWPGADVPISLTPDQLGELIRGADAIERALEYLDHPTDGELCTAHFANASVVSLVDIPAGATLTRENIWVRRPGTGISARHYKNMLGLKASRDIPADTLLRIDMFR